MPFIECHVANSGEPISVNLDAVAQFGTLNTRGYIRRVDGGSVETQETYAELKRLFNAPSNF